VSLPFPVLLPCETGYWHDILGADYSMADDTNLLDQIRQVVREEIAPVRATQQEQGKQLTHLQTDVTGM
jgi:hypothetical protein